jgi:hypothetical protein
MDFIARLVTDRSPGRLVACMDADWRPAFRVEALPSYKAHRLAPRGGEEVPAALAAQVPVIEAVLDALGITRLGVAGFQADDVIGTLAAALNGRPRKTLRRQTPAERLTAQPVAFGIGLFAAYLLFRAKWPVLRTLGVCAALGLAVSLTGLGN